MHVNDEKDLEIFQEQSDTIKAFPEDDVSNFIKIPTLTEVIYETINSLASNHYLKLNILLMNMFYEPVCEHFDTES